MTISPPPQRPVFRNLTRLYERLPARIARRRRFWGWESWRPFLYGLPHVYRYGGDDERRQLMSVFLGVQLYVGTFFGTAALILLHLDPEAAAAVVGLGPLRESTLYVLPLLSFVSALCFLRFSLNSPRFRPTLYAVPIYHFSLLIAGALIACFCAMAPSSLSIAGSVFFVGGAAYAFTFFSHWNAALYVSISFVAYGFALDRSGPDLPEAILVLHVAGTLLVGIAMGTVVSREWSFREQLEEALGAVAYSTRRPLQQIVARAMDVGGRDEEALRDSLNYCAATGERARQELDRAIRDAKYELTGLPFTREDVDLGDMIRDTLAEYSAQFTDRKVECRPPSGSLHQPVVRANRSRFQRILRNILDDAVESATSFIEVTMLEARGQICIQVKRDGNATSMQQPEADLSSFDVYDPSDAGRYGLFLAAYDANLHGGTLGPISGRQPDFVGFEVCIPRVQETIDFPRPVRVLVLGHDLADATEKAHPIQDVVNNLGVVPCAVADARNRIAGDPRIRIVLYPEDLLSASANGQSIADLRGSASTSLKVLVTTQNASEGLSPPGADGVISEPVSVSALVGYA